MKKYCIITNKNSNSSNIKKDLINKLNENNFVYDDIDFNYLFIIGGDGTFLKKIKPYLFDENKKIILINSGNLGFLSSFKNIDELNINDILDDNNYSNIDLVNTTIDNFNYYGINEISIQSNYSSKQEIFINNILIDKNVSNGVLICTPLGSTGRNRSLNGPILLPNSNTICITPIESISNISTSGLNSKIIINNKDTINIKSTFKNHWWLLVDGEENEFNITNIDIKFVFIKSSCKIFIKIDSKNWINRLTSSFIK